MRENAAGTLPMEVAAREPASAGPAAPVAEVMRRASPAPKPGRNGAVKGGKIPCTQCDALSPVGYRFCINCGAVLKKAPAVKKAVSSKGRRSRKSRRRSERSPSVEAGTRPCVVCGHGVGRDDKFCKNCGAPVAAAEQPPRAEGEPFPLAASAMHSAEVVPHGKRPSAQKAEPAAPAPSPQTAPPKASPAAPVTARLVIIVEDGSEGQSLELRGRQVDIGSREGDIVLAEDRYLSARHARFFRQDGKWYIRDLDSVNGVYRRIRKPAALRAQDLVLLGLEVLEFAPVELGERGLGHAVQHGVLVFGSPATGRRARLCQRTVEGVVRDVYHLVANETTIGRETGDIVFTSDPFMSRRHAAIHWDEDSEGYILTDLNSSNGTYLAIREDVALEHGDYIRIGQHLFRVDLPATAAGR
ncbi:MAG: FHA domain-containing protein [Myxococcota bacterium]